MTETIFYDDRCGLCQRSVLFVERRDKGGSLFRFEPLPAEGPRESIVVRTTDGRLLKRSEAVAHILARLGGRWRLVAFLLRLIPQPLRDWAYNRIAAHRQKGVSLICSIFPRRRHTDKWTRSG